MELLLADFTLISNCVWKRGIYRFCRRWFRRIRSFVRRTGNASNFRPWWDNIRVIFDGVDRFFRPRPSRPIDLGQQEGQSINHGRSAFVDLWNRGMEPLRGFPNLCGLLLWLNSIFLSCMVVFGNDRPIAMKAPIVGQLEELHVGGIKR